MHKPPYADKNDFLGKKQIAYAPAPDVLKLLENFPKGERGPAIDEAIRAMYGEESDATKARIRATLKEIMKEELEL